MSAEISEISGKQNNTSRGKRKGAEEKLTCLRNLARSAGNKTIHPAENADERRRLGFMSAEISEISGKQKYLPRKTQMSAED